MTSKNIQQVIDNLEVVIADAKNNNAKFGYFACLYHKMTIAVQQGIRQNQFKDGARMELLDTIFAQRYFEAYFKMKINEMPTKSWHAAFEATKEDNLIVLQHLLLGINAHINLDLGIAAAKTCPGEKIHELKEDFDMINKIIATTAEEVQAELAQIWFPLSFLQKISPKTEDAVINFSIQLARNAAWNVATTLAFLPENQHNNYIEQIDTQTEFIANKVINPDKFKDSIICKVVRFFEVKDPQKVMSILS